MAFNLKKVLKALLLSTNQPLSVKDIQGAFTRFHEQAAAFPLDDEASVEGEAPSAVPAVTPVAAVAVPEPEAPSEPVAVVEAPVVSPTVAAESVPVVAETAAAEAAAVVEQATPPAEPVAVVPAEPVAPVAPPAPAKRSRKSKAAAAAAAAAEAKVSAPVTETAPAANAEAAAPALAASAEAPVASAETPGPADAAPVVIAENAVPAEAVAATPSSDAVPVADVSAAAAEAAPASASTSASDVAPTEPAAAATPPPAPRMIGEEPAEISLEITPKDPELYMDVPSLVTGTQIREVMAQIADELRVADEGLVLIESSSGFRLVTHPRFGKWIRILRQEPPPTKLNQSSIETLAVIAYRQPVTRGEIETIRGVSAEAGITKLLERELIYIVGRADAPGRPIQYGTTDGFLEFVGIKSLDELPASDVLSSRQIDEWLKTNASGHKPTDTDMGLADEQLPLDAPVPPPRTNDDIPPPGGGGGETASTETPQT